ncbi:MAG: DMT family transporter, partial [Natronospirillum sp.]
PVPAMVSVLWLGLIATALAYLTGVAAIRRLSPPVASGVAYLEVVTAIVLAWLLLNETLSNVQIIGAVIVVIGAYLAQRATPAVTTNPEVAIARPINPNAEPLDDTSTHGPQGHS